MHQCHRRTIPIRNSIFSIHSRNSNHEILKRTPTIAFVNNKRSGEIENSIPEVIFKFGPLLNPPLKGLGLLRRRTRYPRENANFNNNDQSANFPRRENSKTPPVRRRY